MMKNYAILGYPLHHTLSPFIHSRLFELSNLSASYSVKEISAEFLSGRAEELFSLNGFNVTIPHKQAIIGYLDGLDDIAARYRSVNTVKIENGKKIGYNTDVYGFTKSIELLGSNLNEKILLLGCGGVGRMMAVETVLIGGELTIAVRKEDLLQAKELAEFLKGARAGCLVHICTLSEIEGKFNLLINATPVGMFPNIDQSPVPEEVVKNCLSVFDAIYNPAKTKLLQIAEKLQIPCLGGMDMLVHQAVKAHQIWYGGSFEKEDIQTLIADCNQRLKPKKKTNIVLSGFMGCGKSFLSKLLAKQLNFKAVETDALIEERENKKISELFKEQGESYFREAESKILKEVSDGENQVISTGGGALINTKNAETLKKSSIIVFIDTPFEVCYDRIKNDLNRPIARQKTKEELLQLFQYRREIYLSHADFTVSGEQDAESKVQAILKQIKI